jgi:hypothetical protein
LLAVAGSLTGCRNRRIGSLINRYYDPQTGQFISVDPEVNRTHQPYQYVDGNPVNETDPAGLSGGGSTWMQVYCEDNPGKCDSNWGGLVHGISSAFDTVRHTVAHLADNGVTEITSHWRGIVKIGILTVTIVGGAACVLASAGVCGALAFNVGGVELSGGAIAAGVVVGAGEGAVDYALDCGSHSVLGYLTHAGLGSVEDALLFGAPEELAFGPWAQGAHSMPLGFVDALRELPSYVWSVVK